MKAGFQPCIYIFIRSFPVKEYSKVAVGNIVSLSTPFDSENVITTTTVEGLGEY